MKRYLANFRWLTYGIFQNIFYINIVAFIASICYAINYDLHASSTIYLPAILILSILTILIKARTSLIEVVLLCSISLSVLSGIIYLNLFNHVFLSSKVSGKFIAIARGQVIKIKESKKGSKVVVLKVENIFKPEFQSKKIGNKRSRTINEKYVVENFQNVENYPNIDRKFIEYKSGFADIKWQQKNPEVSIMINPPKKIQVSFRKYDFNFEVGDVMQVKVFIEGVTGNILPGQFNFEDYYNSQLIINKGFAISEPIMVKKSSDNAIDIIFQKIRQKIIAKIRQSEASKRNSSFIEAMLTSDRSQIKENDYKTIKDSGLAHLISISGLHMSLAAGIFFVIFRYFLVRSQYLALNYDIRKISAFLAIFSSFFYLKIADSPISAVRAFIAICFFMTAILVNKKTSPLRIVFFGALIVAIINPYSVIQIGFQLSFSAILSIVSCRTVLANLLHKNEFFNNFKKSRVSYYSKSLIEILLFSLAAQLATTPFLIYHFNSYPIYSILANIIAIPIASIVTMPMGFASLFLMPFGMESFTLFAMSSSLEVIFEIARFVSSLKDSKVEDAILPSNVLILLIFLFLVIVVSKSLKLKSFSFLLFLLFTFFPYQKRVPDLMIDFSSSNVIINKEKELIFIKKPRKSKKLDSIMEFFGNNNIASYKNCKKSYCELSLSDFLTKRSDLDKLLIIKKRVPLNQVCHKDYDLVINLSKKYQLPDCFVKKNVVAIDNWDLLLEGNHFIYLDNNEYKMESILD